MFNLIKLIKDGSKIKCFLKKAIKLLEEIMKNIFKFKCSKALSKNDSKIRNT